MIAFRIDLQLFADDSKTEKATPKKKQDARKKGQVLHSREVASGLILVFILIGIKIFGGFIYKEMAGYAGKAFSEYFALEGMFSVNTLKKLFIETMFMFLKTTAPIFAIALITGLIAGYSQVGFLFTTETISMKFNRINPFSGMKRILSVRALVELIKSIAKIAVIGIMVYQYLEGEADNILNLMNLNLSGIVTYIGTATLDIALRICIALVLLGILDFIYQWWDYEKSLKMSKQEVKEEYKQVEGNPEIKSKIKQKQRQISMRRMLQDVPKADVIITNPTHFAIAIKYDGQVSDAPLVVAKGQDFIALRIKETAKEHNIQIVENQSLARNLYATVEVGESIPPELYQAVAEVLAFVYSLKGKGRAG